MFLFGHLGIGSKIVSPLTRGLPRSAVLWGAILPDLIDKPLYYGLSFLTGKRGEALGMISSTRTFAHTGLFLLLLTLIAIFKRSRVFAALALGVASHLVLDSWTGLVLFRDQPKLFHRVVLWPFFGTQFPVIPYQNLSEHLSILAQPVLIWAEIIGAAILAWDYWKKRRFRLSQ
jgi:hypothetical protein